MDKQNSGIDRNNMNTIEAVLGLQALSPEVSEKVNRQNLTVAVPILFFESLTAFSQTVRIIMAHDQSLQAARGLFAYILLIVSAMMMLHASLAYRRERFNDVRRINGVLYFFLVAQLIFGFQLSLDYFHVGDGFVPFYIASLWAFLLFNVIPFATISMTIGCLMAMSVYIMRYHVDYSLSLAFMFYVSVIIISMIRYYLSVKDAASDVELKNAYAKLEAASRLDPLSGLCNREALRKDFDDFIGQELIIMLCDVDNFKIYNDRYGHDVGDQVIEIFGNYIAESFGSDYSYRYGGDEFMVVYTQGRKSFEDKLKEFQQMLRREDARYEFATPTSSIGYAYGHCDDNEAFRRMFKQADSNLYLAKERGRDQAVGSWSMEEAQADYYII